jgi:hypothetical protein
MSPLLALSGHFTCTHRCPLSGAKRTSAAIARELRLHPKAAEIVNLIGPGSKVRRSPLEIGHIRIGSGWKVVSKNFLRILKI